MKRHCVVLVVLLLFGIGFADPSDVIDPGVNAVAIAPLGLTGSL